MNESKRQFSPDKVLTGERPVWEEMRQRILRASNRGRVGVLRVTADCLAWVTQGDANKDVHEIAGCYFPDASICDLREAANQHLVDLGVLPQTMRMASVPARHRRDSERHA